MSFKRTSKELRETTTENILNCETESGNIWYDMAYTRKLMNEISFKNATT